MLNISPMADGTIPQDQQDVLVKIGEWLKTNGEAIYNTRPWSKFMESGAPVWHFTTKGDTLYAIASGWPGPEALITSVTGKIDQVTLLGNPAPLAFTQDIQGLKINLPATHSGSVAWAFRITGRINTGRELP
jgi:alpha-L-fucosidase